MFTIADIRTTLGTQEAERLVHDRVFGAAVQRRSLQAGEDPRDGVAVRVVSMPCTDIFDSQPVNYRQQVLPPEITARVVVEAGVTETWWRYAGDHGQVIGINRFGESAPASELFEHFGFSTENVVRVAKEVIANK